MNKERQRLDDEAPVCLCRLLIRWDIVTATSARGPRPVGPGSHSALQSEALAARQQAAQERERRMEAECVTVRMCDCLRVCDCVTVVLYDCVTT